MKSPSIDSFVDAYVQALKDGTAAVFAGAGFSIPAGLVDWKTLLKDIARDLGLDVHKESDLVTLAQFHVNEHSGRHQIHQALIVEFTRRAKLTVNHRLVAALPISTYWTTNYDSLIEDAIREAGRSPDVKRSVANLATTLPRRDAVVYKMHGDISEPDKAIVTKDDYESYSTTHHLFSTALHGDLVSKTFLFIGFSFNDPNLAYILARIRLLLGENRREHYCLLRRVQRSDFDTNKEYVYAGARQELQVRDLRRYGIIGLLVDDYKTYTTILQRIDFRFKASRAFISGSASDFAPWNAESAHKFLTDLSKALVLSGTGLVSGFGLGVGSIVINGALEGLEEEGASGLDQRLILRPFPLAIKDPATRRKRWQAYRKEMLSQAGIAIFVFGNKLDDKGTVVDADGMLEEFRMAHDMKLVVIPVGCTGSLASRLHEHVMADFSNYYPVSGYKQLVRALRHPGTPTQVAGRVLKLIMKVQEDRRLFS
jgi:hypothetical protein